MSQSIKKRRKRREKSAEYSNKHYTDSKMDRMSLYSTQKEGKKVAGGRQEQKGN
jgi:hypothetical protein